LAKSDIRIVGGLSGGVFSWSTDDRDTSTHAAAIKPGEPLEAGLTGNNFAVLLITGEPVQASSTRFIGIAHSQSTETATVEGEVDIEHIVPMSTVLEAKATTAANVNTLAEWRDLQGDAVTFDGISAVTGDADATPYTIDEDEGRQRVIALNKSAVIVSPYSVVDILENLRCV
jgi:hypothetical protein